MTDTLLDLDTLHLDRGCHTNPDDGMCLIEAASIFNGDERMSDDTSSEYRQHVAQALASSAAVVSPAELPALPEAESAVPEPTQDDLANVDPDTGEITDAEVMDPDEPTWPDDVGPGTGA